MLSSIRCAFQQPFPGPKSAWISSVAPQVSSIETGPRQVKVAKSPICCSMRPYLQQLTNQESLNLEDTKAAINYAVSGNAHDAEIAALLCLLSAKGETVEEVAGVVASMRTHMVPVVATSDVLDIVGTGGDCANTVNISTAASIVAAAAGCKVAKHGNRSVSSKSGSADVLEELGIELSLTPEGIVNCIKEAGIGFMYAPNHHPAMRFVGPVRKAMKIRTVFNIIGPLLNPCGAKFAVIGVYTPDLLETMADVLISTGVKKAVVVHTAGLDEYSNTGVSEVIEIDDGEKRRISFNPQAELGMPRVEIADLRGGDATYNADVIRRVLGGDLEGPIADAIALNAGVGCYVYGLDHTVKEGVERVKKVLKSGKPLHTLETWAKVSQSSQKM